MKLKLLCILGVLIGSSLIGSTALAQESDPPTAHQIIQEYEGAKTCAQCHRAIPQQVAETMHYSWLGVNHIIEGTENDFVGASSNYYGLPASVTGISWLDLIQPEDSSKPPQADGCAQCHIGFGSTPNAPDALTQDDYDNIDCLICHGPDYVRTVATVNGIIKLVPVEGIDAVKVAQIAQLPTNETCLRCHLSSGGGPNYEHGDSPTSPDVDVHVAAGLQCTDCHQVEAHRFEGSADLKGIDRPDLTMDCATCHDGQHSGEAAPINGHLARVACQTCHIPAIARDPTYPTLVQKDWTQSQLTETGLYAPARKLFNDVIPVYRWWNGMIQTDSPDPASTIDDADAKITPWKYIESLMPVDAETKEFLPIQIEIGT